MHPVLSVYLYNVYVFAYCMCIFACIDTNETMILFKFPTYAEIQRNFCLTAKVCIRLMFGC